MSEPNFSGLTRLRSHPWLRLMRIDRPIGTLLLLWPTLWSLWLAGRGFPDGYNLCVFCCGVVVMRAAGCIVNDYADRHIDGHVERTKDRPLVTGEISPQAALVGFVILLMVAFALVLQTNRMTILYSFGGLALVITYPYVKRWSHFPQVVLGMAWAWVVPMSFAAERGTVPAEALVIYLAVVAWTVVFDSFYAMVDRPDDRLIGVKSTALLWAERELLYIGLLQLLTLACLALTGYLFHRSGLFFFGLAGTAGLFVYQLCQARGRQRAACFRAFLNNHWVGLAIFVSLVADIWLYPFPVAG